MPQLLPGMLAQGAIADFARKHQEVQESFNFTEKSKQLLEIAKTVVERAIETDEATATGWMNQQLEALGVKLTNESQ